MSEIVILVGTMTGNAEMVAEDMVAEIEAGGDHSAVLRLMDDLDESAFDDRATVYLIVTSTYGQGDVPDNAMDFYEALSERQPDLSGVSYGLFGLGDQTYADTYNHGGRRFDDVLQKLGARRIGERHAHDANDAEMPEEKGVTWVREWLRLLPDALGG